MSHEALKVGELARRTGLTVRTLHHYHEIGLVVPSLSTGSGHRLYTVADLARLTQVLSLRQLGFSLEEIRDCLERPGYSPLEVVALHIARLDEQIELQRKLRERLETVAARFREAGKVSADEFLQTIEVMTMIETYYTPEQLENLRQRREAAGPAGEKLIQQGTSDWAELMAAFQAEMEKGTDPAAPQVQQLEQRRRALVQGFTGGDTGIEQSLTKMWQERGTNLAARFGYDPRMLDYLAKVAAAAKDAG